MTPITILPTPSPKPTILNRQQLDAVVENIVQLQIQRAELESIQEKEIAAIRQKYRTPLAEIERYLTLENNWAETWAQANRDAFGEKRSLECTHATVGFRTTPPRVERASRKWLWSAIATRLGEVAWGQRYLRIPAPEVNKEALLADRAHLAAADLRLAGIRIVHEERFYITPHVTPTTAESEQEWQEAA
jgi:phage host-nuclease inhibitor protein Gam